MSNLQAVNPENRSLHPKYDSSLPGIADEREADQASIYALAAPFPDADVEFAPFKSDKDSNWAIVGPYVDVRAVRRRLNRVLGVGRWDFSLEGTEGGMIATLRATLPSGRELIGQDAAGGTQVEKVTGGASSAMRRAAASVAGIGEYFYKVAQEVDPYFVDFNEDGKREVDRNDAFSKMPSWARLLEDHKAFVEWAAQEGVGPHDLNEILRSSDLPVNHPDEITRSMKGAVADLVQQKAE